MPTTPARLREWSRNERDSITTKIEDLRPWYYSFDFGGGLTTRQGQGPIGKFEKVLKWLPQSLDGASCLDCPSNNAQLLMLLKDRGAGDCIGRDVNPIAVNQGVYLKDLLGYDIDVGICDVHKLHEDAQCKNKFDYTFCLGLLYHLTDMFGALKQFSHLTKNVCFIETEVLRIDDHNPETSLFIEGRYASDATNWWIPGVKCLISMARAAGFRTVELIDYWEHPNKVSREGSRMQARGIFRASNDNPLPAPRFVQT